jgi:hypothetical protein
MINGWFVGNFEPSIIKTQNCEVAIKKYNKGVIEPAHFHKMSKEITAIVKGTVRINNVTIYEGQIVLIEENEIAKFEAIEDVTTVVFKTVSIPNDKFIL